jgi:UDP-glucose-4-epimerase GalE
MVKWVAVTGASGYVGSHICKQLKLSGYNVIGVDRNLNNSPNTHKYIDRKIIGDYVGYEFFDTLSELKPVAVVHCAANSLVGPSVSDPSGYYDNNVIKMKRMLDELVAQGIKNFVFSSSSSIYGNGHNPPVHESAEKRPLTSYGKSKYIGELMLQDYAIAYGMNSISFRYFNACGADPDSELGQVKNATHLIARIMESVTLGTEFNVYGSDYNTPDGTCIRDYTHVEDIARAHVQGIEYMTKTVNTGASAFNLGSGTGSSVLEIIHATESALDIKVDYKVSDRREGDPDCVYADITQAGAYLGWKPKYTLKDIVTHAYNWYTSKTFKEVA